MKNIIDLSNLKWTLRGFMPDSWRWSYSVEAGVSTLPEIAPLPAKVPGSVQSALLRAGLIKDWNFGMNARDCEWVENRDWIFATEISCDVIPAGAGVILRMEGLDGNGCVMINGKEIGTFDNAFIPYEFDITSQIRSNKTARLEIVFMPPPRWLGQTGYTSRINKWKPRFNYGWDWISRLVQIGIWDRIFLQISRGPQIEKLYCTADADPVKCTGGIKLSGKIRNAGSCSVKVSVKAKNGKEIHRQSIPAAEFAESEICMDGLPVSLWWPNGMGKQNLYDVAIELVGQAGATEDVISRTVGFRHIEWRKCDGAPENADPWICLVNDIPVFLQGVNWTPLRPNFADSTEAETLRLVKLYRKFGCNVFRVWGGAVLEKESFYRDCDEQGLMVWQEFPLSSSGIDNWPPEDETSIEVLSCVAESYIRRRQHHPSLLLWCGGNELQQGLDGRKTGGGRPVDNSHPLIGRFAGIVKKLDPSRRFLPTSASGPRCTADEKKFGKGLHWDVHGPWKMIEENMNAQRRYWKNDDALFHSEAGCPGASPVDIIKKYSGESNPVPVSLENPLWRRTSWWFDRHVFAEEHGREPHDLEEYVGWSQERQSQALAIAAQATKSRFPKCGGFIIWMGHDGFPCTSNTSIIDFEGRPKPAANAVAKIFLQKKGKK